MDTVVTAMDARKRFGEILNRALYRREETLIERKGKVVAKVAPVVGALSRPVDIRAYAGMWRNASDVRLMKGTIARGRRMALRRVIPI